VSAGSGFLSFYSSAGVAAEAAGVTATHAPAFSLGLFGGPNQMLFHCRESLRQSIVVIVVVALNISQGVRRSSGRFELANLHQMPDLVDHSSDRWGVFVLYRLVQLSQTEAFDDPALISREADRALF
jgi:hypothetical protein|tara:strand:+ start:7318 stop:7698 length:381 start_codon:yes stop_codon:yes gene_type:complete